MLYDVYTDVTFLQRIEAANADTAMIIALQGPYPAEVFHKHIHAHPTEVVAVPSPLEPGVVIGQGTYEVEDHLYKSIDLKEGMVVRCVVDGLPNLTEWSTVLRTYGTDVENWNILFKGGAKHTFRNDNTAIPIWEVQKR